jgi:hypothetical protein
MLLGRIALVAVLCCVAAGGATSAPPTSLVTSSPATFNFNGSVACPSQVTAGQNITCTVLGLPSGADCIVGLMVCPANFTNTTSPTIMYNGTNAGSGAWNFTFLLRTAGTYTVSGWFNMARVGGSVNVSVVAGSASDARTTSACVVLNFTSMQTRCTTTFNDQFDNLVRVCSTTYIAGGSEGNMTCSVL